MRPSIYKTSLCMLMIFASISRGANITYSVTGVEGKLYDSIINNLNNSEDLNPQVQYLNNIDTIKQLAKPYGYFFTSIKPQLTQDGNAWHASYDISLGKQMRVTSVTIINPAKVTLPQNIIKEGDAFTLTKYQNSKDIILAAAKSKGYPNASVAGSEVNIDLDSKLCNVKLVLELGKQHKFGKVSYNTDKIEHNFLNKFAPFSKDDVFDKSRLPVFKKNLEGSTLFNQATVVAKDSDNGITPIEVDLDLKPQREYLVGFGFDTDEYLRGLFEMTNNLSSPYGHTSKIYAEASTTEVEMGFKYYVPGKNPTEDKYIYSIYLDTQNDQKVGTSRYIAASALKSKKRDNLTFTHSFNLHYEKSDPTDSSSYYSTVLYPKAGILYYDHNDKNIPNSIKSEMISWHILAAAKSFSSSINMIKSEINANLNYNLTRDTGLYARVQAGGIISDNFTDVPLTFQFTAGGSNSIRGYTYNSIGPNKVIELINLELYHKIYDNWYFMLFYDIGNTFSKFEDHNFNVGIGPGILWQTPVGDAKLSVAQAITKENKPWGIQFSFNPVL